MRRTRTIMRIYAAAVLAAALLLIPQRAGAQAAVVHDPVSLAAHLKNFVEEGYRHLESIEQLQNQLATQKANLETLRSTVRVVSRFYENAGVLLDVYDAYEAVQRDINKIQRQAERLRTWSWHDQYGYHVTYPIESTTTLIGEIGGKVYDTYKFVRDDVLDEGTAMTPDRRLELIKEGCNELRHYHNLLSSIAKDLSAGVVPEATDEQKNALKAATAQAALGSESGTDNQVEMELERMAEITTKVEELTKVTETETGGNDAAASSPLPGYGYAEKIKKTSTLKSMTKMATLGVTVLFIILIAWGYGVFNHGDRQRTDILFKVFGGYLVVMVVIVVFNSVFDHLFL